MPEHDKTPRSTMDHSKPSVNQHSERPLVTFALFAYNQEKFIREAVEGALAQTYSPLQIVLSDDFSSDRTFEIMQEMADCYSGPHSIVLNQNQRNLGVGAHVNRIMELADGELVVAAAGDDISLPNRASALARYWVMENRPAALCSDCYVIDEDGKRLTSQETWLRSFSHCDHTERDRIIRGFIKTQRPALLGCTEAWSAKIFETFGELSPGVWFEDNALSFRALIVDKISFVPEKYVFYRQHGSNICHRKFRVDRSYVGFERLEAEHTVRAQRWSSLLESYDADTRSALRMGLISDELSDEIHKALAMQIKRQHIIANWWLTNAPLKLLRAYELAFISRDPRFLLWSLPRLLPKPVFLLARSIMSRSLDLARQVSKKLSFA